MKERVEIPYFDERYTIDRDGNVFNGDKMLTVMTHNNNPNCVSVCKNGKSRIMTIAKLMILAFLDADINDFACYKDGDLRNIQLSNLYVGSRGEAQKNTFAYRRANGLFNDDKRLQKTTLSRRTIFCVDPKTKEVIASYADAYEAALDCDVTPQTIMRACMSQRTCCHKLWCFDSDYLNM